jgi:glutathione S-transferase
LQTLDGLLQQSTYLFEGKPSLADLAIFPFIRQFANVDKNWFDQNAPQALRRWLDKWLTSAEFCAVMTKYPAWLVNDPIVLFPETNS